MSTRLILVTRATGVQCQAVTHVLLTSGHQVRVLAHNSNGEASNVLKELGVDIVVEHKDNSISL